MQNSFLGKGIRSRLLYKTLKAFFPSSFHKVESKKAAVQLEVSQTMSCWSFWQQVFRAFQVLATELLHHFEQGTAAWILRTSLWNENRSTWVPYSVCPFQSDHSSADRSVEVQKVWLLSRSEWFHVMRTMTSMCLSFSKCRIIMRTQYLLPCICEV